MTMKTLLLVVLFLVLCLGAVWYVSDGRRHETVRQAEEELAKGAVRMKDAIQEKLSKLSLRSEDIKEELARTGRIVRRKAAALSTALAEAAADTKITAAIKAKHLVDPDLSVLSISVNTTDGVVTLSGSVASHEHIGKAMLSALETEGVREVISTLQVRQVKDLEAEK